MKFRDYLSAWLPVVFWVGLMSIGSTDLLSAEQTSRFLVPFLHWLKPDISPGAVEQIHILVRKSAHVTEYAILTGLFFRALRRHIEDFWRRAAVAFIPALVLAAADEYHQSFLPSRTASVRDVFIDYAGAAVGIAVCRLIYLAAARRSAER